MKGQDLFGGLLTFGIKEGHTAVRCDQPPAGTGYGDVGGFGTESDGHGGFDTNAGAGAADGDWQTADDGATNTIAAAW